VPVGKEVTKIAWAVPAERIIVTARAAMAPFMNIPERLPNVRMRTFSPECMQSFACC
jgi:hypothetical protein